MGKKRVLVVDDDRDFAEGLAEVLELGGYEVALAFSGEAAVSKFSCYDFDIAFMDVKLPGKNGVESFLEIRKLKPMAKVVMMTAYSMQQLLDQAVKNGAFGVLHKPLNMKKVLEIVEGVKPEGILIADDDPEFVESVKEILEQNGYNVFVACDGGQAISRVKENKIDVLILDMRMPVLCGYEVYLELQKLGCGVPTIIVTAYADIERERLDLLRALSVSGFLSKPFDPKELLAAVNVLIQ